MVLGVEFVRLKKREEAEISLQASISKATNRTPALFHATYLEGVWSV